MPFPGVKDEDCQMNVEWIRRYCMSLPHTTETVQWAKLIKAMGIGVIE